MKVYSIGGSIVKPRETTVKTRHYRKHKLTDSTLRMVEAIPFWPETIAITEIVKKTGISYAGLISRLATVQEPYKIFEHEGQWSRLKDDLSNIDEGEKDV